jgi:hypothetical protein
MKNAILILSIAACAFSAGAVEADSGTVTAEVDTVTVAEGDSTISVIDDAGVSIIFNVTPETAIYGDDDEAITLDDIKQNDTVRIEYESLADGVGTAKKIKKTNY